MQYNHLGQSGLKVSQLSFGSWVTFSKQIDLQTARACLHEAYEHGINFFDNAESYSQGAAESLMGQVMKDFKREDVVISTKLFFGGDGPNASGLSRKHLMEGIHNSLKRLDTEYVDLLYCHRPDPNTPILETVLAMNDIIRSGKALYWGTSEWSAEQIKEAFEIAYEWRCIPPTMEQPQYNMFHRSKIEEEYLSLYEQFGLGTTTWSPLAFGVLSGKYNEGIPDNSRFSFEKRLIPNNFKEQVEKVKQLSQIARELGCSMAQLAIAWCMKNSHVNTVITGASRVEQLIENIKAIDVKKQLSSEVMGAIDEVLATSINA